MLWSPQSMLLFQSNRLCCGPLSLCCYSNQTDYAVVHSVYVVILIKQTMLWSTQTVYVVGQLSLRCNSTQNSRCCKPLNLILQLQRNLPLMWYTQTRVCSGPKTASQFTQTQQLNTICSFIVIFRHVSVVHSTFVR